MLAVCVEADEVIFSIEFAHAMLHLMDFGIEAAEHAFEGEDEIEAARLAVKPVQFSLGGRHDVPGARDC